MTLDDDSSYRDKASHWLQQLLECLSSQELASFWSFAARESKALSHHAREYTQLCVAVRDAERSTRATKASVVLPKAARRLSVGELQRAISSQKTRLLQSPGGVRYVAHQFPCWVQTEKVHALLAILDAVHCPHDERGVLNGPFPSFTPAAASTDICKLTANYDPHDLTVACGALILNGLRLEDRWKDLNAAFQALRITCKDNVGGALFRSRKAAHSPQAHCVDSKPDASEITAQDVDRAQQADSTFDHSNDGTNLTATAAERGELPDLNKAILPPQSVAKGATGTGFAQASGAPLAAQGDCDPSGSDEIARAAALELLERCCTVRHVSDANFSGCREVARMCDALRSDLAKRGPPEGYSWLDGARALLDVIEKGNSIEDNEADRLQELIESTFGRVVATAALRGRLTLVGSAIAAEPLEDAQSAEDADSARLPLDSPPPQSAELIDPHAVPSSVPTESSHHLPSNSVTTRDASTALVASGDSLPGGSGRAVEETLAETEVPNHQVGPQVAEDPTLEEFEQFRGEFEECYWIDGKGHVGAAPWINPFYSSELSSAAISAWSAGEYSLGHLYALGAKVSGGASPLNIDDLQAADRLFSNPLSMSSGIDAGRISRLRAAIADSATVPNIGFGLTVMLEAVRPAQPCTLSTAEIDRLLTLAQFNDPAIAVVVTWALNAWSAGINPMSQMREQALAQRPPDPEALKQQLINAERNFRDTVATVWSGAGGRLQRTHCRHAWTRFIQQVVVPLRNDFGRCSSAQRLSPSNVSNQIRSRVSRIGGEYAAIMKEVKFQDRAAADNAAQQIIESLCAVEEVLQLMAGQVTSRHTFDACPIEEVRRILNETSSDATDRICAALFRTILMEISDPNPMRIPVVFLLITPSLVKYITPDALRELGDPASRIPVSCITDIRVAAALLVTTAPVGNESSLDTVAPLRALREIAIESDRRDILSALSPTNVLASHERTLLLRGALDVGETIYRLVQELERLWAVYDILMIPGEERLRSVVNEASELASSADQVNSLIAGRLVQKWLAANISLAERAIRDAIAARIRLAYQRSADIGRLVEGAFERKDYQAALAYLNPEMDSQPQIQRRPLRQTLWRDEAIQRFREPRRALSSDLKGNTSAQQQLVKAWVESSLDPAQREQMRRLLYVVASGEAEIAKSDALKRSVVRLTDLRDHKERKTVINCITLREYFQAAGLNPTFLPQLADISQIVITSSAPNICRGPSALDDWARIVAAEAPGTLVAFVEPGISAQRRDELCDGLRRRGILAAVIDDIDLCRICVALEHADSPAFIALLEVLLEQLDLLRISPFSTQDGQHVRVETFVGRSGEAESLALRAKYSCVFSGRKLGKSALLKYVARKYDRHRLPSGNLLNVIFITIAGGESEHWVASCIVDEMARRFSLEGCISKGERPRDRLSSYMHRFLDERPTDSVLLVLDEADTFVEGQLANYDIDREASLSFCLLKELPVRLDKNGLPRIRTVFSGYRITNTRDGVWANAGDVLVLHPLQEEEAVQFLTGTLARVGVDIGEFAPYVARRCGRQPAVLIRFGECLLKRLARNGRSASREWIRVSESIVASALTDQGVLDEIRTVVSNNFQGNRFGQAIFGATLMALKELAPGHALTDGSTQVLEKLRQIDSDLSWFERFDASPTAVVERNLQDFIDRELLTVSESQRFGVREYRLRFPHFLPVLTQSETGLEVRQIIQAIRSSTKPSRLTRCALSDSTLDKVRHWYLEPTTDYCKLIVVGGHWLSALSHEKCGIADRLGCGPGEVCYSIGTLGLAAAIERGVRVFVEPDLDIWDAFLRLNVPRPIVIVGGIGWLRTALQYVADGGDVPIEVLGQGRLTEETLRWWLESARALHVPSAEPVKEFRNVTDGVPLLAGGFDNLLSDPPATELKQASFDAALQEFDRQFPIFVGSLSNAHCSGWLTVRERQLLAMSVQVAIETGGDHFDLESEFPLYWDSCAARDSEIPPPFSQSEDRLSIQVLISCGLLPVADEGASMSSHGLGRARLAPDGAAARIVSVLRSSGAA